jgi:hypothetical protein
MTFESDRIAGKFLSENLIPAASDPLGAGFTNTDRACTDSAPAGCGKLTSQHWQTECQPGTVVRSDMNYEIDKVAFHA